jgi:hypothetical protein
MLGALRRYHLTMGCVCHPERIPLYGHVRLAQIPGQSDLMAAQHSREHAWQPTRVILRYDGHEEHFTFTPVWHGHELETEDIQEEETG